MLLGLHDVSMLTVITWFQGGVFRGGRRIPLGSLKSYLLCPRRQVLKPGVQHPSLIFSFSLSDLDSSPSSLRGSPSLQSSGYRSGGRRDLYDPQGLLRWCPWRRKWQWTPVFLPGKCHGQRSLEGYSSWGQKRVRYDLVTKGQQNEKNQVSSLALCCPKEIQCESHMPLNIFQWPHFKKGS